MNLSRNPAEVAAHAQQLYDELQDNLASLGLQFALESSESNGCKQFVFAAGDSSLGPRSSLWDGVVPDPAEPLHQSGIFGLEARVHLLGKSCVWPILGDILGAACSLAWYPQARQAR